MLRKTTFLKFRSLVPYIKVPSAFADVKTRRWSLPKKGKWTGRRGGGGETVAPGPSNEAAAAAGHPVEKRQESHTFILFSRHFFYRK